MRLTALGEVFQQVDLLSSETDRGPVAEMPEQHSVTPRRPGEPRDVPAQTDGRAALGITRFPFTPGAERSASQWILDVASRTGQDCLG